jgi:hypothetical protein
MKNGEHNFVQKTSLKRFIDVSFTTFLYQKALRNRVRTKHRFRNELTLL